MRVMSLILMASFGSPASAQCGGVLEPFLTCEIGVKRKALSVCYNDDIVTYRFGPADRPELVLTETVATIDFTPWPGVGRSIWEEVRFHNGDYTYTVYAGFDRMFGDEKDTDIENRFFGSVTVTRNGQTLAELSCNPDTVDAPWSGLFDAKIAAGLTWDYQARVWLLAE